MSRTILTEDHIHTSIQDSVHNMHASTIAEIAAAIEKHDIVIVGMAQNPHVKRARKALNTARRPFEYLEYGSYLGEWRKRLAIKMWSGWPTFPQVYVKGTLIGGADQLQEAIKNGELDTLIG